jgi:prophage regulatory protein
MTAKENGRAETTTAEKKSIDRLILREELIDRVGVSYVTVWNWMRAGTFPRSRGIGGRTAWIESEIADWIASRPIRRLKGDEGYCEPTGNPARASAVIVDCPANTFSRDQSISASQHGRADDRRLLLKGNAAFVNTARRRGRRPIKFEAVKAVMRKAIDEKSLTVESLHNALEKQLAAEYGVSRDTARKARKAVLSEHVGKANIDF